MNELLLMFSKVLPIEKIAEELKDASTEFLLVGNEENKRRLVMYAALLLSKEVTDKRDISELTKEMGEFERIRERMNSGSIS